MVNLQDRHLRELGQQHQWKRIEPGAKDHDLFRAMGRTGKGRTHSLRNVSFSEEQVERRARVSCIRELKDQVARRSPFPHGKTPPGAERMGAEELCGIRLVRKG